MARQGREGKKANWRKGTSRNEGEMGAPRRLRRFYYKEGVTLCFVRVSSPSVGRSVGCIEVSGDGFSPIS